ncbi:M48 family metallopeptidase [Bartonella sp. DGB2]|uniref:M48 family metallopeptidase n=1 Tax=Bartonella sp. DGB2 TaxID=3388426 RepID=UPI00398FD633
MIHLIPQPFKKVTARSELGSGKAYWLEWQGQQLPLRWRIHSRAKRLILRACPIQQSFLLTSPPAAKESLVISFVRQQTAWIKTRWLQVSASSFPRERAVIDLYGVTHHIVLRPGRGLTERVHHEGGWQLWIYGDPAFVGRRLVACLKNYAKEAITPLIRDYSLHIGRKPTAVIYRDTKSQWGSCSATGRLSFSWRIAMASPAVISYLVAHEIAHLREMNHDEKFWQLCAMLCPTYQIQRAWLKKHGARLMAYQF